MVEGTSDPMKGITLLREIEKTDSNNVDLQLAFAAFSSKSGQMDKAIIRFEKVLKLKPDYLEAYLYLADAYEKKGDKQKAIIALESYSSLIEDEGVKKEIKKYINQLKIN
jgi:tetratricopeptide (TPR) repeat protein